MAIFPKIQSPCPHKDELASLMDGDVCRACDRQVHDIGAFSDAERVGFLKACAGEVCVSYKLRLRPALAAAVAAAALGAPLAALAQQTPAVESEVIIVGAIKDPANVEYVDDARDADVPELPVVLDGPQPPPAGEDSAASATDGSASRSNLGQPVEAE